VTTGSMADEYKHWRRDIDERGIYWLTLDKADATSNTLSHDVLRELEDVLSDIESRHELRGLVIKSAKESGFILGADVGEFGALQSARQATEMAAYGQGLVARIERLSVTSVAAIDGYALGGGLELALGCDYRVVADRYDRTLGLPEVQLGIHPGFGGSVRSVALIGVPKALDMMLTGRSLSPSDALAAGLIDRVVPRAELDVAAAAIVTERPARRRVAWYLRILNARPIRPLLARNFRKRVARRARVDHYPAPYAIVDLWERHGGHGAAAYRAEVESIGRLLVTPTCKNLVRMFMLRERLRNLAPKSAAVDRVHVVGGGTMGGDIASWCALRGLEVTVQDREEQYVRPALERAEKLFTKRLREPGAAVAASRRLRVDIDGEGVPDADVTIEAIVEDLDAKRALFGKLEPELKASAILATNTSSIRLEEIAGVLSAPERLVGLHFFNPVAQLPLVEVISGDQTSPEVARRALAFVTQIGKLPLPCRSAPGFVVNRVLTPYLLEALHAHEDGYPLETIDSAAKAFGMPMGPIELADQVGLDVALSVARILSSVLGSDPPPRLEQMVASGRLGLKTNGGFYAYEGGKPRKARDYPRPDRDLQDRLMLPLVNEAMACYSDGVVADTDLLDAGVVFGTGFAPFTGGPIRYATQRGIDEIVARLEALAERFGPRFQPHPGWQALTAEA
jgi:3-hydroxyacyl-CoA dehydrogenase / enoyl-CoA hydratase / 3-hydroxybutyryl-CoA epimerase